MSLINIDKIEIKENVNLYSGNTSDIKKIQSAFYIRKGTIRVFSKL
ncbi:hypothetical protein EHRUM2_08030 [Ehrlichia ruminantium]|uniref:Uncharacterized protein n=1 Tax=Ehrlichia ruminantium TaxID=779 RepID=A0A170S3E4_EHRRU|nr:hypothetical protein [Ehrlichia ruminantium]GAT77576.1 hypothetical protein EHRUM2_08030 [Ehrlichia ruminantium]